MGETDTRRKRINHLKRVILWGAAAGIVLLTIACVILGIKVAVLTKNVDELQIQLEAEESRVLESGGVYTTSYVEESPRESGSEILSKETEGSEETELPKKVYLTFDDGPSSSTNAILDILKAYDVKATFFVVGKTDEASKAAYKRIVAEGHTLGMHSYSHKYHEVYQSEESFITDLSQLQEYLYDETGVWSRYYRFPGGSSNKVSSVDMQDLISWVNENGITYYDWNIESGDAVSDHLSKEAIVNNCLKNFDKQSEVMILMHDAADKKTTVEALPEIITQIRLRGDAYFLPITDETEPIQHVKARQEPGN
ncbi:MAG: polysaccharide deacetylase [Lachnospiraceae bacterium]|nr:polysaccharide deacetylase [Lachnospiraceae bacterium]